MNRRIHILGVAVVLLTTANAASALYTPNPVGRWAPQHFYLAGDFQFTADKNVELDSGGTGSVDDIVGVFVRPGYSIVRNVVIYGRLGFQDADHVDLGFAGGFGVQGAYVLPGAPEWAIGGAFDYVHWTADIDNTDRDIDWNEFQLTPAVSYQVAQAPGLTPYAGLMLDFVDARNISESDPVGLLFGTNYDPNPHLRLDAQFRVISETGFLFSVGYIF